MTSDPAAILRARARALAAPVAAPGRAPSMELLLFRLDAEEYGVETKHVSEVHRVRHATPLPGLPPFFVGVINVRGRIVPVLDLRGLLGLSVPATAEVHEIVIVQGHGLELGLVADETLGVSMIPAEGLQASLPTLTGLRADYLKGVTAARLVVLDLDRLLADPGILVHEEVQATRTESR